jgi:polyhydroxyalkanoic acid synthase PhaR subunit
MADQAPTEDPFTFWRSWLADSERQWNSFLNQAMSSEEFSQSLGRLTDVYLDTQRGLNDTMGRYLQALSMPTRTDVLSIASRLNEVEERLASIERLLTRVAASLEGDPGAQHSPEAAPIVRPPRTKRPA